MNKFQSDTEPTGGNQLTLFSVVGSRENHANHTQPLESGKERMTNATSGPSVLESYAKFNRSGAFLKTFPALLVGMEGWYSTRCRLTWKLRGTKSSRLYFQLQVSTLRTEGTGCGLLHTPSSQEPGIGVENLVTKTGEPAKIGERAYDKNTGRLVQMGITQQVKLLKTPCAADAHSENLAKTEQKFGNSGTLAQEIQSGFVEQRWPGLLPTPQARDEKNGSTRDRGRVTKDLNDMATWGLLPTPTAASDAKGGCTRPDPDRQHDTLAHAMHEMTGAEPGTTSQLNPRFVAELMGFPPNWTELPFQSTATNP